MDNQIKLDILAWIDRAWPSFSHIDSSTETELEKHCRDFHKNTRVLVVDDVLVNIKMTCLFLKECGVEHMTIALNGAEAIAEFAANSFDLVILDVGLPDMSGIEVCRQIRHLAGDRSLAIVVCTADVASERVCLAAGCDAYMLKPVTLPEFKLLMSQFCQSSDSPAERD